MFSQYYLYKNPKIYSHNYAYNTKLSQGVLGSEFKIRLRSNILKYLFFK